MRGDGDIITYSAALFYFSFCGRKWNNLDRFSIIDEHGSRYFQTLIHGFEFKLFAYRLTDSVSYYCTFTQPDLVGLLHYTNPVQKQNPIAKFLTKPSLWRKQIPFPSTLGVVQYLLDFGRSLGMGRLNFVIGRWVALQQIAENLSPSDFDFWFLFANLLSKIVVVFEYSLSSFWYPVAHSLLWVPKWTQKKFLKTTMVLVSKFLCIVLWQTGADTHEYMLTPFFSTVSL